jgi:hypothetical protein
MWPCSYTVSWAYTSRSNFDVRCCITANHKMLHHNARRVYITQTPLVRFVVDLLCKQVVQQIHNKSNKWSLSYRPTCLQPSDSDSRVEYSAENMPLVHFNCCWLIISLCSTALRVLTITQSFICVRQSNCLLVGWLNSVHRRVQLNTSSAAD